MAVSRAARLNPKFPSRTSKPHLRGAAVLLFSSTPEFAMSTPMKKAAAPICKDPKPHIRDAASPPFSSTPRLDISTPRQKSSAPT
jgi:hypothetical protein